jgi:hypothetical protein
MVPLLCFGMPEIQIQHDELLTRWYAYQGIRKLSPPAANHLRICGCIFEAARRVRLLIELAREDRDAERCQFDGVGDHHATVDATAGGCWLVPPIKKWRDIQIWI